MTEFTNKSSMSTVFNSLGTSFYPVGMGLSVNLRNQGGYKSWKGTGVNSNPVGIAQGHIRLLTNNDIGNIFPSPFGKPRPLKHYRKGRVIPNVDDISQIDSELIQYNLNRSVKSSKGTSLGGGFGGSGLLNEMQDKPGSYLVKLNPINEDNEELQMNEDCTTCQGVGIVDTYYPNKNYLTENPEPVTTTKPLCCNQEKFALKRVRYATTNLSKNYYTTHKQYLQNRCKLYNQKAFNFETTKQIDKFELLSSQDPYYTEALLKACKPGDPLSITNTYFANCQPNSEIVMASEVNLVYIVLDILLKQNAITETQYNDFINQNIFKLTVLFDYLNTLPPENSVPAVAIFTAFVNNPYYGVPLAGPSNPIGCKLTIYKPNNPQFAQQGAVDSSTRILKLNVTTIEKNAAVNAPFLYKNKPTQPCEQPPLNFFPTTFKNKKLCRYVGKPEYFTPVSQNSPYRYDSFIKSAFSRYSNHYRQSPNGAALL